MRRFLSVAASLSVLLAVVITPTFARSPQSHSSAKPFTVGLVTDIGGLNDKSFNHLAYLGLQEAIGKYHVRGLVVESKAQTDYVPNLTHFAQMHANLTVAVGFLMANAIYTVAKQYPNLKFAIVDSAPADAKGNTVNLPNVANLFFREQESGYLVGIMSGLMEKNHVGAATRGVVGAMGGISIPPVNRYIAGYVAGVRQADPRIKHILVGYSQSFTDQAKSKNIGLAQISQGADILFAVAGSAGLGYMAAAQERGKYAIGVDADQSFLGRYVLSSAVKKVDVAVATTINSARTGRFKGGDHVFSLKNKATGFGKFSPVVPAWVQAQVKAYAKLIRNGKITPPTNIPPHP